ncbi:hypothetical protein H6B14_12215 [Phocaeicola coprophilus]|nr:hypothetical protein [Phocaeicola coprophilus]
MKKDYIAPHTEKTEVEMEQGFMSASIFDSENEQDDGVSIGGHEVGNTGDYTDIGWDNDGGTRSTWGN